MACTIKTYHSTQQCRFNFLEILLLFLMRIICVNFVLGVGKLNFKDFLIATEFISVKIDLNNSLCIFLAVIKRLLLYSVYFRVFAFIKFILIYFLKYQTIKTVQLNSI